MFDELTGKTRGEVTDYFNFITWVKCLALGQELKSTGIVTFILKITMRQNAEKLKNSGRSI